MNAGYEGIVTFGYVAPYHGYEGECDFATIPPASDINWNPAPDADLIGYSQYSTLCGVLGCRAGADFTYFQSFVDVPGNVVVTTFTIAFTGIDDGVRVTIFNSDHPTGAVVPGSYVFLGGSGTADVTSLVRSGEINRVVVTHTDDCCSQSYLNSAQVTLNGTVIPQEVPASLDIKPGSCPNPLNPTSNGVLPMALIGTMGFDIDDVDPTTLLLEGTVMPVRMSYEDVSRPVDDGECACTTEGPDGLMDLTLKFRTQAVAAVLGPVTPGDVKILTLTGHLVDGTPFVARDCMVIRGPRPDLVTMEEGDEAPGILKESNWSLIKELYR